MLKYLPVNDITAKARGMDPQKRRPRTHWLGTVVAVIWHMDGPRQDMDPSFLTVGLLSFNQSFNSIQLTPSTTVARVSRS